MEEFGASCRREGVQAGTESALELIWSHGRRLRLLVTLGVTVCLPILFWFVLSHPDNRVLPAAKDNAGRARSQQDVPDRPVKGGDTGSNPVGTTYADIVSRETARRPTEGRENLTQPIEGFFGQLARRADDPLLRRASGSVRIDLQDGAGSERWLVVIQDGSVSISHRNAKADCIIRTSKQVFEGLVTGNINAMAATLRGLLVVEGDPNFLVLIQRAFPSPPKTRSERVTSAKSPTS